MKLIFTACTGRCGQNSLASYLNLFGKGCFAEVEPPDLIYKQNWPLGNFARNFQRKWIVTDEDLGRGKALTWHDNDENDKLARLARKRIIRISKFDCSTYVELSKFFIRSYCDAVYLQRNDIGIINLYRNPIANARSFVNREKKFALDGVMPFFKKACFKIDIDKLSKFQLYLWQWVEIYLRSKRFVEEHGIKKYYEFRTEDLNDPEKVLKLFNFFEIETINKIEKLQPKNTNFSQGKTATRVSKEDLQEFHNFLKMIPSDIMGKISFIHEYSA